MEGCFRLSVAAAFLLSAVTAQLDAQLTSNYPTRSDTDNLPAKRYVAAGDRAYVVGTQDGGFPGMGFHIQGHMNGVWAHPIKLLDSYAFSFGGVSVPAAQSFTSGPGYVQMQLPPTNGVTITRTEFSPDGIPVVLVGLALNNTSAQVVSQPLSFSAISEILPAFPWSGTTPTSDSLDQPDQAAFDPVTSGVLFSEPGKSWRALVSGRMTSKGPQDTVVFTGAQASQIPGTKRANGTLTWNVTIAPGSTVQIWIAIAGSNVGPQEAYFALFAGLSAPADLLTDKIQRRVSDLSRTRAQIPDATIQAAFDWAKLNLADMRRVVRDAQIRDTMEGTAYPDPEATFAILSGFGAGYPDYPWYFGTDGAYTTFAQAVVGDWREAEDHLRTIREVSRVVNGSTGKVLHEIVTDGSIYFGTTKQPGDTNETPEFATAVATVWRWSGDDDFLRENYQFISDGLHYITSALDLIGDGWPEGAGMVEAPGMGAKKLDVAVYTMRALSDFLEMAQHLHDKTSVDWAQSKLAQLTAKFENDWWDASFGLYADSLCFNQVLGTDPTAQLCKTAPEMQLEQLYWINATPMETAFATVDHATTAFPTLESPIFTGTTGYFQEGQDASLGVPRGNLQASALNTSVMAVAEANYGRTAEALRYVRFIATELDTEQPGALPELFDSPDYVYYPHPFTGRAMVMQAWSSYGVEWPVIYHFLGVRPDVPARQLTIIPNLPDNWPSLSVDNLRVGDDTIAVAATRNGGQITASVSGAREYQVQIGVVVPPGTSVQQVTLNGEGVSYQLETTTRGQEVVVSAPRSESLNLAVTVQ